MCIIYEWVGFFVVSSEVVEIFGVVVDIGNGIREDVDGFDEVVVSSVWFISDEVVECSCKFYGVCWGFFDLRKYVWWWCILVISLYGGVYFVECIVDVSYGGLEYWVDDIVNFVEVWYD